MVLWSAEMGYASRGLPLDLRLTRPLHLHVGQDEDGNDGIIGRKISVCASKSPAETPIRVLAEGIVGFNHLPRVSSHVER